MSDFDWKSLEDPIVAATPKARETFPCEQCAGTGHYRGPRVHQQRTDCFACGGKGFFYKSFGDRMAAKAKRDAAKVAMIDRVRSALNESNPDLIDWMETNRHWCTFAGSLLEQVATGKELSERQLEAMNRIRAKSEATRAAKLEARTTDLGSDLTVLRQLISRAIENGKTKPTYRALGLTISEAPAHGRNAGALYVVGTEDKAYFGKIVDGKYIGNTEGSEFGAAAKLMQIAADPKGEAIKYGVAIGRCFCCGAKLTDPKSVARGIGPICFGKWGFA